MTPEQHNSSFDYLNTLNIQQLCGILRSELDEEEVNVELIKKINAVLASKTEKREIDVDSAYDRLRAAESSGPLYSEIIDEMEAEPGKSARPRPRARFLLRVGMVAALVAVLLIGTGIVASAMGFDFWGAVSEWTEDRFGFPIGESIGDGLYGQSYIESPYSELHEALDEIGVTVDVVPKYLLSGYSVTNVVCDDGMRGLSVICILANNDKEIILNYIMLTEKPAKIFTKDIGSPEVYVKNEIEHYIFTNENNYCATWINQNVQCEIREVGEKEELLKMIDSIYEER